MLRSGLNSIKALSRLQVFRFLVVGAFSFFIEFALFAFLIDSFQMLYMRANLIAMAVSVVCNYFLTRNIVFEPGSYSGKVTFSLFVVFTLIGVGLNQLLLWFLVEKTLTDIRLSKILSISVVSVFNYLAKKHVVFRR